jgi:hypothetical protein
MADIEQLLEVSELTAKSRVQPQSREGYNSKIKYVLKFMEENYPQQVEGDNGSRSLKLPLSFESIQALFAKLMTDTDLPKNARKRQQEAGNRREELNLIREAAIAAGADDDEIAEIPEIEEDTTINKANSITVSKSCLGGYKSALKMLYSDNKVAFECPERPRESQPLDKFLDDQIKCYANLIADKKNRAIMSVTEGKAALTEEGFVDIINKLIAYKPKLRLSERGRATRVINWNSGIFGWLCALMQKNHCSRVELLDNAHLTHFQWQGDHLVTTICKHKKDQGGSGLGKERSIYANPLNPELCMILAFGVYLMSKPRARDPRIQKTKLFEGHSQKTRFCDLIKEILDEFTDDEILQRFGVKKDDLASHSIRKYILNHLLSLLDGPNVCAVYIRAGWSLGNTQDRYILGGLGEDNLIGRLVRLKVYLIFT